ncbi:sigma factor-like helix-turn-helix DNA-binding protein [uncultured Eubacterium sp.]|jgi:RNA polymerase sigma factor (sigma-70 family)|uniref:sigma factor-like helix-turn-helix DNA-binding protein n=1 Tax=uncultured Eubacterium sp. TaxID=165185 RepID=UPI0032632B09
MTRKELEAYKVNERLIERNLKKIEEERYKDIPTVYGKVKSSMAEHPYIETHMAVQMEEPVESDKRMYKLDKWSQEIDKAKSENTRIEEFIDRIEDIKTKEIFVYRFIDNKSVKEIAGIIGCSNGRVSQLITNYLNE